MAHEKGSEGAVGRQSRSSPSTARVHPGLSFTYELETVKTTKSYIVTVCPRSAQGRLGLSFCTVGFWWPLLLRAGLSRSLPLLLWVTGPRQPLHSLDGQLLRSLSVTPWVVFPHVQGTDLLCSHTNSLFIRIFLVFFLAITLNSASLKSLASCEFLPLLVALTTER